MLFTAMCPSTWISGSGLFVKRPGLHTTSIPLAQSLQSDQNIFLVNFPVLKRMRLVLKLFSASLISLAIV